MDRPRGALPNRCSEPFSPQMLGKLGVVDQHLAGLAGRVLENGH
jgi:hypothetical protein